MALRGLVVGIVVFGALFMLTWILQLLYETFQYAVNIAESASLPILNYTVSRQLYTVATTTAASYFSDLVLVLVVAVFIIVAYLAFKH